MLTSLNLSNNYSHEKIDFKVQIKIFSPQSLSTEIRTEHRDQVVENLRINAYAVDSKNYVYIAVYDTDIHSFINSTPKKFLEDIIKVALIRNDDLFE